MIPTDMTFHYFSATRIYNTRSVGILCFRRQITQYTITCIIQAHCGIVRPLFGNNGIFKSGCFKSNIPIVHTGFKIRDPFLGCRRVYIVYNRAFRFSELPSTITFRVFRFQPITLNDSSTRCDLLFIREFCHRILKKADPFICQSRLHRLFRQHYHTGIQFHSH